jgi:hypothetical protein
VIPKTLLLPWTQLSRNSKRGARRASFAGVPFPSKHVHFFALADMPDQIAALCGDFSRPHYTIGSPLLRTWNVDRDIDTMFLIRDDSLEDSFALPKRLRAGVKSNLIQGILDRATNGVKVSD